MSHQWSERLSDYLDGELSAVEQGEMDDHLATCEACGIELAELRRVVGRAQALDERAPASDIWPGIAQRIGISLPARPAPVGTFPRFWVRSFSIPGSQLMAAGIALILLSGGASWLVRGTAVTDMAVPVTNAPVPLRAVSTADVTTTRYDRAIADLLGILERNDDALDPETVRILRDNLTVIDRAIERSRVALLSDPDSEYLRDHFEDTMRTKMTLLQRVTTVATSSS